MVQPLLLRAARALLAGALALAWGVAPALPHSFSAPGPRPAVAAHWGVAHGQRGLIGRGRFGFDRRETFAHGWRQRNGWGRYGWGRYGWGRNGWGWNGGSGYGLAYGGGYWDGAAGYADPAAAGGAAPVVFAPSLTVYAPVAAGGGNAVGEGGGGCVIHKLEYDAQGRYVGEKQYPGC